MLTDIERSIRESENYRQYQWNNGRQDALLGRGSARGLLLRTGDQGADAYQQGWADGLGTIEKMQRIHE